MAEKPAWRAVYDQVAAEVGPRLTEATGSDGFAEAAEIADAVRVRASSELRRGSRRFLHAWNLPAGTDVAMMRQELGALNREVRALARQVEDLQRQLDRSTPMQRPEPAAVEAGEADAAGPHTVRMVPTDGGADPQAS